MFLLVFVHGYNLDIRYMQPWTVPGEPMTFTAFTEYFLANGIFRFRIPMLFIISGYLFALHDDRPYKQRVNKRLKTLLLPYLLWSAFGLLLTFAMESFPGTRQLVSDSRIMQIDENRWLLHDYHWYEILGRWIIVPVPYQLWFIRVLLIYNIAYPWIRKVVLAPTGRWIFFSVAILLWLGTFGFFFFEGEGLLFFSLGVWMQKTNFSIETPLKAFRPSWWGIAFLLLAALKTGLAFLGQPILGGAIYPVLTILHKLTVLSGLIFCWFGLNGLVRWCMNRPWFVWLSAFSFMIYALHAPLVAYLINPALEILGGSQLLAFILLPLAIILCCVITGSLLRALLPRTYSLLTGGRGLG